MRAVTLLLLVGCSGSQAGSHSVGDVGFWYDDPHARPEPPPPGLVLIGDIVAPPTFDPKPALTALKPELLRCYSETRLLTPDLHGKVTLQITINENGSVRAIRPLPGGEANDPGLVACIRDAAKVLITFPKPGGAVVLVVPLEFRR
jgi:hypothetical protein